MNRTLAFAVALLVVTPTVASAQSRNRDAWREHLRRLNRDLEDLAHDAGEAVEDGVDLLREGAQELSSAVEARRVFKKVRDGAIADARRRGQRRTASFLDGIALRQTADDECLAEVEFTGTGRARFRLTQGLLNGVRAKAEALPSSKQAAFRRRVIAVIVARQLAAGVQEFEGRDDPTLGEAETAAILAGAGINAHDLTKLEAKTAYTFVNKSRRQALRDSDGLIAGTVAAAKVLLRYGPAGHQASRLRTEGLIYEAERVLDDTRGIVGRVR